MASGQVSSGLLIGVFKVLGPELELVMEKWLSDRWANLCDMKVQTCDASISLLLLPSIWMIEVVDAPCTLRTVCESFPRFIEGWDLEGADEVKRQLHKGNSSSGPNYQSNSSSLVEAIVLSSK